MRLHRWLLLLLVGFGFAALEQGRAAPPDPQASTAKKSAPRAAASKKPAARRPAANRRRAAASRRWRPAQYQPSRERYAAIQTALIGKGFLEGPATGNWDEKSIGALKSFQDSNSLEPTGRINSLSLIALGLGPNHGSASAIHSQPTE